MRLNAGCKIGCQQNAPHLQSLKSECQCMKETPNFAISIYRSECMMHVDKNADVLPRGSMDLKFGHASQRFDGFEIWTCFPEV